MSNQPDKSGERRRSPAGNQGGFSPWHYASQPELRERILNKAADVNKIGIQYAINPTQEDAAILVRYFHGYLVKYVDLLAHGSISTDGKRVPPDTKNFLCLFRSSNDGKRIRLGIPEMQLIANRIPNAFISMTPDDIYNEMVILFLELAHKYDPDKCNPYGNFLGYVTGHFKFSLKQRMMQVQRDALNYIPLYEEEIEDNESLDLSDDEGSYTQESGYHQESSRLLESIGLEELNHSFVSNPPDHLEHMLTRLQRKIMVLFFCEGLSFSQISKQLNFGNATSAKAEYDRAIVILQQIADINALEGN